jgi:hypothetical protein
MQVQSAECRVQSACCSGDEDRDAGIQREGYRVQVCRVHGDEEGNDAEDSDTDGRDAEGTNAVGIDGRGAERR